jgi:tetratricopeptide (TPR) repeat protein
LFGNLTVSGGSNPFFKVGMINQWRLQKLDDALAAYDRAIGFDDFALDSEAAEAYYRRAEVLMWQGYGPGYLIEDLETAVALDPTYVQAHIMLAVVQYKHDGDLASAEANIQRVLALDPNNASAYLHLGDIYALAGMGEHASNMYEAALALAPDLHNEITERQNNLQDN